MGWGDEKTTAFTVKSLSESFDRGFLLGSFLFELKSAKSFEAVACAAVIDRESGMLTVHIYVLALICAPNPENIVTSTTPSLVKRTLLKSTESISDLIRTCPRVPVGFESMNSSVSRSWMFM